MKKWKSKEFFYNNSTILGIPARYYVLIGGRGCGKTYSTQNYMIKKWFKTKEPILWLRLKEPSVKSLLANNAMSFLDNDLMIKYQPKFEVKGNFIYWDGELFCKVMALSTFYSEKGVNNNGFTKTKKLSTKDKISNKALEREIKKFKIIVLDEMNSEKTEKRTFDICYAFVNTIETTCRRDNDKRVFLLGNTLDIGSELLSGCFQFVPNDFGIYRLPKKHTVIHCIEDSEKWKQTRKEGMVGDIMAPGEATFTNVAAMDKDLVSQDKSFRANKPSCIIAFDKQRFLVIDNVITSFKVPEKTKLPIIAMQPLIKGVPYIKDNAQIIIDRVYARFYRYDNLTTLRNFYTNIKLLKGR